MRGKLHRLLAISMLASLVGIGISGTAHGDNEYVFTIQNLGSGYCLDALYPAESPNIETDSAVCDGDLSGRWRLEQRSSNLCVYGECGPAYYISSDSAGNCLSQNNAGSAYLTPCTDNDYQTWILYPAPPPGTLETGGSTFAYLINYASRLSSTEWCLSSNLTAPPDSPYPASSGTVYTTAFNTTVTYHRWYIATLTGILP